MKGLKRKFIISLIAIMFAIVALGASTYAYWSSIDLTAEVANSQVTIGEGRTATVTASLKSTLPAGKVLVPAGQAVNSVNPNNSVESVTFKYEVIWIDDLVGYTGSNVDYTISDVKIGTDNSYASLVKINGVLAEDYEDSQSINMNDVANITLNLTLDEPGDATVANAIFEKNITFTVTFDVRNPVVAP